MQIQALTQLQEGDFRETNASARKRKILAFSYFDSLSNIAG